MGYIRSTYMKEYIEHKWYPNDPDCPIIQYHVQYCDKCSNKQFEIGQVNWETIGKCIECGHIQILHEG